MRRLTRLLTLAAGASLGAAPLARAQQGSPQLDSATLAGFHWRNVGPANMGGRVADIAGIPSPSKTFYIATAGGGIWKTTNAGTSFFPIFDHEPVISMGALAIAPSDTNQVWAGTGEQNSRNTIEPGGGIYKSTDGGKTWTLMGLENTQQIARIVVHPTNPNIVYVAALGHAWEPNKDRGLYKTEDGGKTWKLVKFIDDRTGFVDVAMDPSNPNVLYAAAYQRQRGPYYLQSGGPGSGLWKTTDGGTTWTEISGGGFPATTKGRIGLAISRSNPNVVYALVEADSVRGAKAPFPVPLSDSGNANAAKHNRLLSGLYRSEDGGKTWQWMNDKDTRPFYYSQVRVDPQLPNRVYWSSTPVQFSDDGGRTVRTATNGIHVDHHAMWIDPNDPQHFIVGDDGGVSQTWDRGGNYDFMNQFVISQAYEVTYDFQVPYRICGGLQDNGSWCGPSRKKGGEITNADWFTVGGGDGFYTAQDPTDPNTIYSESQGGNIGRVDYATGERKFLIKPTWRPIYMQWEDSILIARGDTTKPAPKDVQKRIAAFRARQRTDSAEYDLRFNWNTPYFVSPHSHTTLYLGGNRVLKSTNRGDDWQIISPDLSTQDQKKIHVSMVTTGGITNDATGAETYGTVVTLAESPIKPGLLYAGTDDGNFWVTHNDGAAWEKLTGRFPGVPPLTYVTRVEPSHFDTLTFYVAFENHRNNDFTPYLYVTNDGGQTFRSIAGDLPHGGVGYLHVIREDPVDRDLLFAGTDVGAYVSLDRGAHWQRFMSSLPTVAVHDLKIHPRDHDLIAATHGRGFWIVNIAPLEQMTDKVIAEGTHLFAPATAYEFGESPESDVSAGQKTFAVQSAPYGAEIAYRLTSGSPRDRAKVVITDVKGDTVQTLNGPGGAGLHWVTWNFRGKTPPPPALSPAAKRDSIVNARKMQAVFDSLAAAGVAPRQALDRLYQQFASGSMDFRALFRRGGGERESGPYSRPGEGPLPRKPGERPARGQGAQAGQAGQGAGGELAGISPDAMSDIFDALRSAGIFRGFGGFGRGGAPEVDSGDYLVSLTVGGQTQKQVLRVERVNGTGAAGTVIAGDDDMDP